MVSNRAKVIPRRVYRGFSGPGSPCRQFSQGFPGLRLKRAKSSKANGEKTPLAFIRPQVELFNKEKRRQRISVAAYSVIGIALALGAFLSQAGALLIGLALLGTPLTAYLIGRFILIETTGYHRIPPDIRHTILSLDLAFEKALKIDIQAIKQLAHELRTYGVNCGFIYRKFKFIFLDPQNPQISEVIQIIDDIVARYSRLVTSDAGDGLMVIYLKAVQNYSQNKRGKKNLPTPQQIDQVLTEMNRLQTDASLPNILRGILNRKGEGSVGEKKNVRITERTPKQPFKGYITRVQYLDYIRSHEGLFLIHKILKYLALFQLAMKLYEWDKGVWAYLQAIEPGQPDADLAGQFAGIQFKMDETISHAEGIAKEALNEAINRAILPSPITRKFKLFDERMTQTLRQVVSFLHEEWLPYAPIIQAAFKIDQRIRRQANQGKK